ncbi:MAG: NUDIX hydrolase [Chloroflexi bacterium]|nr:NUDIX hydrolase [Chloroflexota bacterium]
MPIPEYVRTMRARIGHDLLVMVGAAAVIRNDAGEVLLQLRRDNGRWGLPGGAVDPGEDPAAAVIREVLEETGLVVVPERIVGVYGGPELIFRYPNGDEIALTSITFACRVSGGALGIGDDESLDLRWFAPDALPDSVLPMHRERIHHAVTRDTPYFRVT